jgi:hypothetical protein
VVRVIFVSAHSEIFSNFPDVSFKRRASRMAQIRAGLLQCVVLLLCSIRATKATLLPISTLDLCVIGQKKKPAANNRHNKEKVSIIRPWQLFLRLS